VDRWSIAAITVASGDVEMDAAAGAGCAVTATLIEDVSNMTGTAHVPECGTTDALDFWLGQTHATGLDVLRASVDPPTQVTAVGNSFKTSL